MTRACLTNLSPELAQVAPVPALQFVALRVFPSCNNVNEPARHRIARTMKDVTVTRDASKKNPAYLIHLDDEDDVFLNHTDPWPA